MHGPHLDIVTQAKIDLQRAGISLSDDCGAFQIVKLVAWRLKSEGAGLLSKPTGAGCQGYAKDIIAYQDGQIYDILIASGDPETPDPNSTGNRPAWNDDGVVDASRWREPISPAIPDNPIPVPSPTPIPIPTPTPIDLGPIIERLDILEADFNSLVSIINNLQSWRDDVVQAFINDVEPRIGRLESEIIELKARKIPTGVEASVNVFGRTIPIHATLKY